MKQDRKHCWKQFTDTETKNVVVSEIPAGCSAHLIRGFELFEHSKAQAQAWMEAAEALMNDLRESEQARLSAEANRQRLREDLLRLFRISCEPPDSPEQAAIRQLISESEAKKRCQDRLHDLYMEMSRIDGPREGEDVVGQAMRLLRARYGEPDGASHNPETTQQRGTKS